jgi:hypothetical protein
MSKRVALVIANSEYEDPNLTRLMTPGEDASGLAEVLCDAETGVFDEVITLINEPAITIRRAISPPTMLQNAPIGA